jgi:MFS transporter, DHA1 family, inner membrane transport protein
MSQSETSPRLSLWLLLLGNFIIGTGILLPAGLLNAVMEEFSLPASQAGLLLFVGGLVVGIGAPVLAGLTARMDRRLLLVGALVLYGLGHLGSALAPSFELQLLLRAVTVIGAAVGLLVPPEKRASAIAFIFIGWSCASIAGIPLGTLLADAAGWRMVYGLMSIMSLTVAAGVWFTLRPKLYAVPLDFAAWKEALTSPLLWLVYLVTLCSMSGQFTLFGYIAPILKQGFGATAAMISVMFAIVGVAGVTGNTLASKLVGRFGIDRVIAVALLSLCAGFVAFALSFGNIWAALLGGALWGLGSFSSNSLQQSRLVALAPALAAATVALNTSVVYLGQSIGSWAGGKLVDGGMMSSAPFVAFGFIAAALGFSLVAAKITRQQVLASSATPKAPAPIRDPASK